MTRRLRPCKGQCLGSIDTASNDSPHLDLACRLPTAAKIVALVGTNIIQKPSKWLTKRIACMRLK